MALDITEIKIRDKVTIAGTEITSVETTLTGGNSALPRADAVKAYVDSLLNANDAMQFKGTIGTGGTVTALPTTHSAGWTYRVITAATYAGVVTEVGDLIIAVIDRAGTGNANSDWTVVQTNIDGAVVGPASAVSANIARFNGTSGKLIQDSGISFETTLTTNSDAKSPTSKAVATYVTGLGYTTNTGTVTGVTGTAPIASSGGTAPAISITAASQSAAGSMSSADKTKLDGIASGATANTGTVTSVGGTGTVAGLTLSGTVTTTGNLTLGGTLSTPVSTINDSTTVGQNLVKLANPSAIRFIRINANNTVDALTDANFRTAIGAGTSSVNLTVETAAATAAKTTTETVTFAEGVLYFVKFTLGNSVSSPTLNGINIRLGTSNVSTTTMSLGANAVIPVYFDASANRLQITGSYRTSDSTEDYNLRWENSVQAGATITRYKLIMEGIDGRFYPLTIGDTTAATKTVSTQQFRLNGIILQYQSTTTRAENATFSDVFVSEYSSGRIHYTFNQSSGFVAYRSVYLKGTINSNGHFVLDNTTLTSWLTQTLPTTDDGFVYVYLGITNNTTTAFRLDVTHPIYEFKDGKLRQYTPTHTGDVTGATALTIADDAVTFAKMQNIDSARILGRVTASIGDTEALTAAQVRTLLNVADGATANTGTVTSVGGTGTVSGLTLGGTVTTTGNLTLSGTLAVLPSNFASQTANTFLAAPNGTAGVPTFRAIVAADVPTLNQNTTGNAATVTTNANLTGDVTSVGNATAIAAGVIVNADINASAGIVDTKLATISTAGKVSNSATTATSANTASTIVARDGSGNFSAGAITGTSLSAGTGASTWTIDDATANVLTFKDGATTRLEIKSGGLFVNGSTTALGTFGTTAGTYTQGNDARLSDARTPLSHTHGNILNNGTITAAAVTIQTGDRLLITNNNNSQLIERGIDFGTSTTSFLANNGTWVTPAGGGDVTGPASAVSGRVATFNGTTGKIIQDGGILLSNLVSGPASSVNARIATFNGTTGKLIQDSGTLISGLATSTHTHGNITNAGAIGASSGLVVVTGASGVLTTEAKYTNLYTNSSPLTISSGGTQTVTFSAAAQTINFGANANLGTRFRIKWGTNTSTTLVSFVNVMPTSGSDAFTYLQEIIDVINGSDVYALMYIRANATGTSSTTSWTFGGGRTMTMTGTQTTSTRYLYSIDRVNF